VFLPIDMRSFCLPDAYWVEDDHILPKGPDGEHVIYLSTDKEVLMQPDNNSYRYPIYYGQGRAVFAKNFTSSSLKLAGSRVVRHSKSCVPEFG